VERLGFRSSREGRRVFPRRPPVKRFVRTLAVVQIAPTRDHRAGVLERDEVVFVEAFVAQPAVEAFDVGVLDRLARCDMVRANAMFLRPDASRSLLRGDRLGVH
jgi:hypothetical protein